MGVPQGGALSPILHPLRVNALELTMKIIGMYIGIFADDVCIFTDGITKNFKNTHRKDQSCHVQKVNATTKNTRIHGTIRFWEHYKNILLIQRY